MPANYDPADYWGKAVTLLTGYGVPRRSTLFDQLKGNDDIPLFRIDIEKLGMRAVTSGDYTAIESGWQKHNGRDYEIVFYTAGGDGSHGKVEMNRARIVFIGTNIHDDGKDHLLDQGEMVEGYKFGKDNSWDYSPVGQYISGPKAALDTLLGEQTTRDFKYNGLAVLPNEAVDLKSFERSAQAFDRAIQFFELRAQSLQDWEKSMGDEQAAWRGQAAGVFWHLLHQVRTNFDSYVEQLGGKDFHGSKVLMSGYAPKTKHGDALAGAQQALVKQAQELQAAWSRWAGAGTGEDPWHDPHRALLNLLDDVTRWVLQNNASQILVKHGALTSYQTTGNFQENHPFYGNLREMSTWRGVGQHAVELWNERVEQWLVPVAKQALVTLGTELANASENFGEPLRTKDTSTLTESYTKDKNKATQEESEKNQEKLNEFLSDTSNNQKELTEGLNNLSGGMNNNLSALNEGLGNGLSDLNQNLGEGLGGGLNDIGQGLNNLNTGVGTGLNNFAQNLNENLGGGLSGLNDLGGGTSDLNNLGGIPEGGTSDLNDLFGGDGGNSLTNPDGSTTQLNNDGTLTTAFPNGGLTTFNPNTGTMTTSGPDGKTTTTKLNTGSSFANPDGSTTTLNPDGTLTTKYPDGTTTTVDPSTGSTVTKHPDGTQTQASLNPDPGTFTNPGGSTSRLNADGTLTTMFPDGTKQTLDPSAHTVSTKQPDGTVTTSDLHTGESFHNPDGSVTKLNANGTLTTKFPDGTVETLNPKDGTLTTTQPDGTSHTTDLDGPSTGLGPGFNLPNPSGHDNHPSIDLSDLGDSGGSNSGLSDFAGLGDGPGSHTSNLNPAPAGTDPGSGLGYDEPGEESLFDDADSSHALGGALGAPITGLGSEAGNGASNGATPLNPMGMGGMGMGGMGMGMGGMGQGQGGNSNGERVRTVHGESGGASLRRPSRSRSAPIEDEEELVLTGSTFAASSSPFASMIGGSGADGRPVTESGDRQRSGWLEEEDVWGTDDGGAPAVIG
ncbi:AAWKG family protein [Streptomyces sp. NPDC051362]|uniref:AAWKG family protein n=1 Tax=Streptomyces sp. NPDC051362 TaxID=3365651 RepID=UPI0037950AC8